MAFQLNNALELSQDLLNNLNKWDLQRAAYNGVQFFVPNSPFGVVNQLNAIDASERTLFGDSDDGRLPASVNTIMSQILDETNKKLAVAPLLNSNMNIVEDQGAGVERFTSIGLIQGDNYLLAWQNLYTKFLCTEGDAIYETISPESQRTFYHPVRGKIKPVYCQSVKWLHTSLRYKAVFFVFDFIAETITTPPGQSRATQFFADVQNIINVVVGSINVVQNTIAESQLIIDSLTLSTSQGKAATLNSQPVLNNITISTIPTAQGVSQIIYNNFSSNVPSIYLETVDVDYAALGIKSYDNSSPQSVESLLNVMAENINTQVQSFVTLGTEGIFNNVIVALQELMGNIYNFSRLAISQQDNSFNTIEVQQDTNLFSLLYDNGYDPNSNEVWTQVFNLNYDFIYSMNYIPAKAKIKLPVKSNG